MPREGMSEMPEMHQKIDWSQVRDDWRTSEEEIWRPLYEGRGFGDWWDWRHTYVSELGIEERAWEEEAIPDPHRVIPMVAIGGFPGWKQYRPEGKDVATFADIVLPPQIGELAYNGSPRVDVRTNQKVAGLVGKLRDMTLIGFECDDLRVLLEGTHRAMAIALEEADGLAHSVFSARIRWCKFDASERLLLETFARDRKAVVRTRT